MPCLEIDSKEYAFLSSPARVCVVSDAPLPPPKLTAAGPPSRGESLAPRPPFPTRPLLPNPSASNSSRPPITWWEMIVDVMQRLRTFPDWVFTAFGGGGEGGGGGTSIRDFVVGAQLFPGGGHIVGCCLVGSPGFPESFEAILRRGETDF